MLLRPHCYYNIESIVDKIATVVNFKRSALSRLNHQTLSLKSKNLATNEILSRIKKLFGEAFDYEWKYRTTYFWHNRELIKCFDLSSNQLISLPPQKFSWRIIIIDNKRAGLYCYLKFSYFKKDIQWTSETLLIYIILFRWAPCVKMVQLLAGRRMTPGIFLSLVWTKGI